jgi:hypothetical protein
VGGRDAGYRICRMLAVLLLALQAALTPAQAVTGAVELSPGVRYDPAIPTLVQVVGHEPGARITTPEEIAAYLRALAAAAPTRAKLIQYGSSWESRPLWLFVIGSPERMASLDQVKAGLRRLADPRRLGREEEQRLIRDLPVVTWLMHGVHGNEPSSSDAALAEAYHLLAARSDPDVDAILRDSIVVIDPLQNPDGRARFIAQNLLGSAAAPDATPLAAEHDEPWPTGRSNHYLFDMNRDWFALSQPETRGRVAAMLEWYPHVVADLHEMDGESTYYFAPPTTPINPQITAAQRAALDRFGRANAARFDERGFSYFVRETYDAFYPGYGESWPTFQGAVGMTFEQASARGLAWRRTDAQVLTFRDGVVHHFTAAITTAATAARGRERLLRDFVEYRRSAVSEGERAAIREYVLLPGADASRAARLARLLVSQGIEVRRTTEASRVAGRLVEAGAYLVSNAQPAARLVRNLLDVPATPEAGPSGRPRGATRGDRADEVTAWSLPLLFDVDLVTSPTSLSVPAVPVERAMASAAALPPAKVAYILPWGSATAGVVAEALAAGIRVRHAALPFTLDGRAYPAGTAIVRVTENAADLPDTLGRLVAEHEAEAIAVDTGYQDAGVSIGSASVTALRSPRVLLAWDAPTAPLSAGWARFVLERRFGQPVTVVRLASFGRVTLRDFDVIVLPSGTYEAGGDALPRQLREWVRDGGTLVTLADASGWAASVGLLDSRLEAQPAAADTDSSRGSQSPASGSILPVTLDATHWLSSGERAGIHALVEGRRAFVPVPLDRGGNVGLYAAATSDDAGSVAGLGLTGKPFLMHQAIGQGHVVAFAEDPNFRAFAEATELLFINAILLGPSY